MDKLIGHCGIVCSECPAYIATKTDDEKLRAETAEAWSKAYGAELKPEHINCVGCTVEEGAHIGHWDECNIRTCSSAKGLSNCAGCADYACENLEKFFGMVPAAKETLDSVRAAG
jgi:hypothetical protein